MQLAIKRISNAAYFKKRNYKKQASGIIMNLACMSKETAEGIISELIEESYSLPHFLEIIQAYPASTLNQNTIFDLDQK
jgi:hypothetical protein